MRARSGLRAHFCVGDCAVHLATVSSTVAASIPQIARTFHTRAVQLQIKGPGLLRTLTTTMAAVSAATPGPLVLF